MVKKMIVNTLVGLGIAQMWFQSNQILADEECCTAPCSGSAVVIGEPLDPCCISAIYPYPAAISLCDGWDIYAKGEFLYLSSCVDSNQNLAGNVAFNQSDVLWGFQKTPYRPGFRVSVGADLGSVVLDITYLRYHAHTTSNFSARADGGVELSLNGPTIAAPAISGFQQPSAYFGNIKSSLHFSLDLCLISLQKPVYMGKRMIMNLNYGILALWTGENYKFTCGALIAPPPSPMIGVTSDGVARNHHKTWAVGPNLGFTATALLPCNLQAIGNIDLALQYGSLYKALASSSFPQYPFPLGHYTIKGRGHADHIQAFHGGEIGIAWGNYLACDRYHVNLSVTYNWLFQHIFANGGAFNSQGQDIFGATSFSAHGIAVGGRFDF